MLNKILLLSFLGLVSIQSFSQKVFTTTSTGTWTGASWSCTGVGCSSGTEKPGTNLQGNTINVNHAISTGFPNFSLNGGTSNLVLNATVSSMSSATLGVSNSGTRLNFTNNAANSIGAVTAAARLDLVMSQPLTMNSLTVQNSDGLMNISGAGKLTVSGNLNMTGNSTVTSNSEIHVGGNLVANNNGTTFTMNKPMTVGGNVVVQDAVNVYFNSSLTGTNLSVPNSSSVEFNGDAAFTGSITMNSTSGQILGTGSLTWGSFNLSNGADIDGSGGCNKKASDYTDPPPYYLNFQTCSEVVLPIVLKDFKVKYKELGFEFNWSTLQEIDNDFFTLEYSLDSKTFIDFAEIKGAGTSYQTLDYDYLDSELSFARDIEVVYFRLKQTDFDGTYDYSHIVPVSLNKNIELSTFHFYPNPANSFVVLRLEDWFENAGDLELTFVGMSGASFTKTVDVKSTETKIDVSEIPTGVYMVISGGLVNPSKLLIE